MLHQAQQTISNPALYVFYIFPPLNQVRELAVEETIYLFL